MFFRNILNKMKKFIESSHAFPSLYRQEKKIIESLNYLSKFPLNSLSGNNDVINIEYRENQEIGEISGNFLVASMTMRAATN